ncbi:hypothetical protein LCGC14_0310280 [marine sediment metagenome]|uniref:Uncharacterized protein n=1 Tax=marine sediment metagenome TaxID=412755 RepID=A0A0F9WU37_9ZZZZ
MECPACGYAHGYTEGQRPSCSVCGIYYHDQLARKFAEARAPIAQSLATQPTAAPRASVRSFGQRFGFYCAAVMLTVLGVSSCMKAGSSPSAAVPAAIASPEAVQS